MILTDMEKSRLGHTYAYGGVGLMINTINKTYDLDIQNYITISFDDLVNVIDEIGGVTVFISEEEAAYYREREWYAGYSGRRCDTDRIPGTCACEKPYTGQ